VNTWAQPSTAAPGIETLDRRALLYQLGCENGHGYLFGGAVPSEELPERSNESSSVCDRTPNALKRAER
jgi:EAL domain-containing protein (putative c-di-GMP-specific phosphodiesterase class I)